MKTLIGLALLVATAFASPAWGQETCTDSVYAAVDGNRIRVVHTGALYNCCPTRFDYDVSVQDNAFLVVESEILENPCYCICCIDLEMEIEDAPPGEYTLLFVWYDYDTQMWRDWMLEIDVPDVGQGTADPVVASAYFSDCYGSMSGVTPESPGISWSAIKETYR